jgi:hypothetical protein
LIVDFYSQYDIHVLVGKGKDFWKRDLPYIQKYFLEEKHWIEKPSWCSRPDAIVIRWNAESDTTYVSFPNGIAAMSIGDHVQWAIEILDGSGWRKLCSR